VDEASERDVAVQQMKPLTERWWVAVVRGFVAVLFGLITLRFVYGFATSLPVSTGLRALVFVWGVYAALDGVLTLVAAFRNARDGRRWAWLVMEGAIGLVIAAVAFLWPGLTGYGLFGLVATWAVLTGMAQIGAAVRLRRFIRGEWLLAASGAVSVLLGILLFAFFGPAFLVLLWMIVVYAFAFGALLIGLGLRLQRWGLQNRRVARSV
jgi:uncharacterized membrane protein HdeD (DUF308 family)